MLAIRQVTELSVHVDNQPEAVSEILSAADGHGNHLLAFCVYRTPRGQRVLLVPAKPQEATARLQAAGFPCDASPALLVVTEREPTIAAQLGADLAAAHVALHYSYTCWREDGPLCVVFKTDDQTRALDVLAHKGSAQLSAPAA